MSSEIPLCKSEKKTKVNIHALCQRLMRGSGWRSIYSPDVYRAQAYPDDKCKLLESFLIFLSLLKTIFPPLNDVKRPLQG